NKSLVSLKTMVRVLKQEGRGVLLELGNMTVEDTHTHRKQFYFKNRGHYRGVFMLLQETFFKG
ncbi:hypothetical protein, partial [Proteus mirabilis]|uniref:hypothetical protein n=1 Tax=Proteus mirabilis TaxID=584 RepID=UPI001C12D283